MTRPVVVVFRRADGSDDSHRAMTAAGCDVVLADAAPTPRALLELARGAQALVGATFRGSVLDREFLESIPELRIVAKYTIGVEDIDVDAASTLGILVTHSPTEANWGGVAEGTIGFVLTLLKKLRERDAQVKRGGWRTEALRGVYLGARDDDGYAGITVGIVGLGRIGTRVAHLLAPWRVRVVAHDPYVPAEAFVRCGARPLGLDALLGTADVVTLHCSLTRETRGLVGASQLRQMKPTAVLVNTARGAVVDLEALCDAIEQGRLAGAALDVLPDEPPAANARVLRLGDRVLLSPHMIAANAGGTLGAAIPWTTAATLAALRGELPKHVYNVEAVARWLDRFGGRSVLGAAAGDDDA